MIIASLLLYVHYNAQILFGALSTIHSVENLMSWGQEISGITILWTEGWSW